MMTSSLRLVTLAFLIKSVMTSQVVNIANDDVILSIHTRAVQASQASSICRENSSELVSIDSEKIQHLITSHIGEIPIDESHFNDRRLFFGFWTSGRQMEQDDDWSWWTGHDDDDDQEQPDPEHRRPAVLDSDEEDWSNYTNWVGYSPVITTYPSCIYVYPNYQVVYETGSKNVTFNETAGGWLNKPCRMRSYFICEKKINKQTMTSPYAVYYVIIPAVFTILCIVIVVGFCFLCRRRARMLKTKAARAANHMELRNGYRDDDADDDADDDDNNGDEVVTNGLTHDTQFNDSWRNDDTAVMTSSTRSGWQISQLNNETYETNIHFTQVKNDDDSDYDEPPDEREYFERNKLFSNFDENDYDMPPDEVDCTHSEFSSDDSYHLSDIEAYDSHSQDQGISSAPPPAKEQFYASIESLNKIERSSSPPRRGVHHQQSLHKITNFCHNPPHRDMSHRKKFPLPHEAQPSNHRSFSNHRATTKSTRSHDTIPEKEFEN